LTGWEAIEGLTLYSDLRYRGGAGVNRWVGASSQFARSTFQRGRLWRFQQVYLTYTTPELFGVKEFLTLSGGWQNPTDIFVNQPLNKFFINNTFTSNRGIGANGIGWGGSYAAWGGYIKIKPLDWYYVQSGLYMAIPDFGTPSNHGLYFAGAPEHNGPLLAGGNRLSRRKSSPPNFRTVCSGFYLLGLREHFFFGQNYDEKLLFYWQADQQLYREPSPEAPAPLVPSEGKSVTDGKEFMEIVKPSKPKLSEQGCISLA
jgi:porin